MGFSSTLVVIGNVFFVCGDVGLFTWSIDNEGGTDSFAVDLTGSCKELSAVTTFSLVCSRATLLGDCGDGFTGISRDDRIVVLNVDRFETILVEVEGVDVTVSNFTADGSKGL